MSYAVSEIWRVEYQRVADDKVEWPLYSQHWSFDEAKRIADECRHRAEIQAALAGVPVTRYRVVHVSTTKEITNG